jgi:hypothetical protein
MAYDNLALFFYRVIVVVKNPRQGIAENRKCFLERNPMLAQVPPGLGCVPLKMHAFILSLAPPGI